MEHMLMSDLKECKINSSHVEKFINHFQCWLGDLSLDSIFCRKKHCPGHFESIVKFMFSEMNSIVIGDWHRLVCF